MQVNKSTTREESNEVDNDIDSLLDTIAGSAREIHCDPDLARDTLKSGSLRLPLLLAERVVNTICSSRSFPSTTRNIESFPPGQDSDASIEVPFAHDLPRELDDIVLSRPGLIEAIEKMRNSVEDMDIAFRQMSFQNKKASDFDLFATCSFPNRMDEFHKLIRELGNIVRDLPLVFCNDESMKILINRIRTSLIECMKEREVHSGQELLNRELKEYRVEGTRAVQYVMQVRQKMATEI